MKITRTIATVAVAAATLAMTAACEEAVEANPELRETGGGYGDSLSYTGADYAVELPQSAQIDSAKATERAMEPIREHDPSDEEPDGH